MIKLNSYKFFLQNNLKKDTFHKNNENKLQTGAVKNKKETVYFLGNEDEKIKKFLCKCETRIKRILNKIQTDTYKSPEKIKEFLLEIEFDFDQTLRKYENKSSNEINNITENNFEKQNSISKNGNLDMIYIKQPQEENDDIDDVDIEQDDTDKNESETEYGSLSAREEQSCMLPKKGTYTIEDFAEDFTFNEETKIYSCKSCEFTTKYQRNIMRHQQDIHKKKCSNKLTCKFDPKSNCNFTAHDNYSLKVS